MDSDEIPCEACGRQRAGSAMIRTLFGGICDDSLECIRWFYLKQCEADLEHRRRWKMKGDEK